MPDRTAKSKQPPPDAVIVSPTSAAHHHVADVGGARVDAARTLQRVVAAHAVDAVQRVVAGPSVEDVGPWPP